MIFAERFIQITASKIVALYDNLAINFGRVTLPIEESLQATDLILYLINIKDIYGITTSSQEIRLTIAQGFLIVEDPTKYLSRFASRPNLGRLRFLSLRSPHETIHLLR